MKVDSAQLSEIMLSLARAHFGTRSFERRELMDLTADEIRRKGLWSLEDDLRSGSAGIKSKGLAHIDYRFSDLVKRRALSKVRYGVWKLTA